MDNNCLASLGPTSGSSVDRMSQYAPLRGEERPIRFVTIAGVTGAIGPTVAQNLQEAGFKVQALTRRCVSSVAKPVIENVNIVEVDYTDTQELESVLRGQDAVISTLGDTAGAVAAQQALVECSISVGVARFIPSEFGSDTFNNRVRSFPFFADKLKHQDLLRQAAHEYPGFSYSIIITGPFLDWGMSVVPFIINVGGSTPVFDGGDVPFSTIRLPTVAKAIVSTLQRSADTKNRVLYVHEAVVTQNQLLAAASKTSSSSPLSTSFVDMKELERDAWRNFYTPSADPLSWIFSFINISMWSSEQLCVFRETDNELLGISELHDMELASVIDEELTKALKLFLPPATTTGAGEVLDSKTAHKAFEDGKSKLIGYCRSN